MLISEENLQHFLKIAGKENTTEATDILKNGNVVIEKFQFLLL